MKSKLLILVAVAVVLASFTFAGGKANSQSSKSYTPRSGKNMVDKGQFD